MALRIMVLRRVLWAVPVAWGVVTITFFLARVVTGDPVELYAPPEADQGFREQIRQQMGLSAPLPVQYVHYLGQLLHLDLGKSFTTGHPVISDLLDRFPATMELGLLGLFFGLLIGVPLGVIAAVNRERWPDFLVRGVTVGGLALPQFWIGLVLLWIFSVGRPHAEAACEQSHPGLEQLADAHLVRCPPALARRLPATAA
jgi:ABC-type dipeptide/oligopeptide/nickel transport system permease component